MVSLDGQRGVLNVCLDCQSWLLILLADLWDVCCMLGTNNMGVLEPWISVVHFSEADESVGKMEAKGWCM